MADGSLGSVAFRPALIDGFGRIIRYLRVSVTDRCDCRCVYCMTESMQFEARSQVLTLEELDRVCSAFVALGVRKLRLTGGEPLVRRGVMTLVRALSRHLAAGALDELALSTNGSLLARHAGELAAAGVRRINVSLDSLDPGRYQAITRWGRLERVMEGLAAARAAGLVVKINCVALKGVNEDELSGLIGWCGDQGFDLTLIEVMPLGDVDGEGGQSRSAQFLPLSHVMARLAERWTLEPIAYRSGGPSRYYRVGETGGRLGLITPLSQSFCESCNRVRLTATGRLTLCLGQNAAVDLRPLLRSGDAGAGGDQDASLRAALTAAITAKPEAHGFGTAACPALKTTDRLMNLTGG